MSLFPQAKKELEEERRACLRRARDISFILNAGIPAVALPLEILREIFEWHLASWRAEHDCLLPLEKYDSASHSDAHGWMTICWVCTQWRAVALNAPALWTNIRVTGRQEPLKAYLERSQAMPLSMTGKLADPEFGESFTDSETWALALAHASRVQSFCVDWRSCYDTDFVLNPSPPFSCIRHLRVQTHTVFITNQGPFKQSETFILGMRARKSQLTELELLGFPFPVCSTLFHPQLKRLALSNVDWGTCMRPWPSFLSALEELTSLRELCLLYDLPRTHSASSPAASVALPQLQRLELSSYGDTCMAQTAFLVSSLRLPNLRSMEVTTGHLTEEGQPALCALLRHVNSTLACCTHPSALRTLYLDRTLVEDGLSLRIWQEKLPLAVSSTQDAPLPVFALDIQCKPERYDAFIDALRHLPLGSLYHLAVHAGIGGDAVFPGLSAAFGQAQDVRTMSMCGEGVLWLLDALKPLPNKVPFSRLTQLKFVGPSRSHGFSTAHLVNCLKERLQEDCASKLEQLTLEVDFFREVDGEVPEGLVSEVVVCQRLPEDLDWMI